MTLKRCCNKIRKEVEGSRRDIRRWWQRKWRPPTACAATMFCGRRNRRETAPPGTPTAATPPRTDVPYCRQISITRNELPLMVTPNDTQMTHKWHRSVTHIDGLHGCLTAGILAWFIHLNNWKIKLYLNLTVIKGFHICKFDEKICIAIGARRWRLLICANLHRDGRNCRWLRRWRWLLAAISVFYGNRFIETIWVFLFFLFINFFFFLLFFHVFIWIIDFPPASTTTATTTTFV